jgi:hypothetical protein
MWTILDFTTEWTAGRPAHSELHTRAANLTNALLEEWKALHHRVSKRMD